MRFKSFILIAMIFAGCVSRQPSPPSNNVSIMPLRIEVFKNAATEVELPPQPIIHVAPFTYSIPLTNSFVEMSTNLMNWTRAEEGFDYSGEDVTNGWSLIPWTKNPNTFYRVVGKPMK